MHRTNHRGHNETLTATTQNQLAYKACRSWRELSHARVPLNILEYHTLTNMRQFTTRDLFRAENCHDRSVWRLSTRTIARYT